MTCDLLHIAQAPSASAVLISDVTTSIRPQTTPHPPLPMFANYEANISPMALLWFRGCRIDYRLQPTRFYACNLVLVCACLLFLWSSVPVSVGSEKIGSTAQMALCAGWFLNRRYLNGYSMLNAISALGRWVGGGGARWRHNNKKAGVCFSDVCRAY